MPLEIETRSPLRDHYADRSRSPETIARQSARGRELSGD